MKANLAKKATATSMRPLLSPEETEIERPGREPTTDPDVFFGRRGYDREFLDGWTIKLPEPIGPAAEDVRKLRRGGSGHELKYQNFSVIMSARRRLPMLT